MSFLWSLIPGPAKIWVALGLFAFIIMIVGVTAYKINKGGYTRCQGEYVAAAIEHKDTARKDILNMEKKYEDIKDKIVHSSGDNSVGVRVGLAIDSVPGPHANDRKRSK